MDNRGYSQRIVEANRRASDTLGVLLGRYCISRDISATLMAEYFGVSRMTIYKWFTGKVEPRAIYKDKIKSLLLNGGWQL